VCLTKNARATARNVIANETTGRDGEMSNIIGLYYVGLEDEPDIGFYEKDIEGVVGAIEGLTVLESGLIVKKVQMEKREFDNLPWFPGF